MGRGNIFHYRQLHSDNLHFPWQTARGTQRPMLLRLLGCDALPTSLGLLQEASASIGACPSAMAEEAAISTKAEAIIPTEARL